MTSETQTQTIVINKLLDISEIKGNQKMKFGHSIKYNVINIFLQKSCRK